MGFRTNLLTLTATLSVLASSSPNYARAHGDEGELLLTSAAFTVYAVLLNPAGSAFGASTAAAATTAISAAVSGAARKEMLVATLEDAAEYFNSGKLTGILPEAVRQVRETCPEVAQASDAEIVNAIVDAAYQSVGEEQAQ